MLRAIVGLLTLVFAPAASAAYLNGIDVSHWQGNINWVAVKNAGTTFAICKATEGLTYTDAKLMQNIAGMKANGIIPGVYHFARPGSDALAQANRFLRMAKLANGGSYSGLLQLVLDLEATDGLTPAQVWTWTQTFCARVHQVSGRPCIIYTGFYFWRDNVGNPTSNLNCPLWLAAYVPESQVPSLIPQAWSGVGWAFWQYTSTGSVNGVTGNVDRDYFRNTGSYPNIENLRIP